MARHAKHEIAPRRRRSPRQSPSRGIVTLRALGVLLTTGVALLCLGFFQGGRVRDPVLPTVLPDPRPALSEELSPPEPQPVVTTLRFLAAGDNLIHAPIYKQAARRAAEGEGYRFDECYENLNSFFAGQDINWINQETLCTRELEPSTYPCFSTPGQCAEALYRSGFRVFSLSNNHTYDKGASGIAATLRFWESMPEDVITTGLWKGEADYGRIPIQTVQGVRIAYLSYTEHTNGIPQNSKMTANVIYTSQTDIIEQQVRDQLIGAVLTLELEHTAEPDGSVHCAVRTPKLHPTVTHYDAGKSNVRTYLFRDYTPELAQAHGVRADYPSFGYDFIRQTAQTYLDPEFLELA